MQYKFRGKRKDNGEWVEGCYQRLVVYGVMKHFILPSNALMFDDVLLKDVLIEVHEETVGMFTNLTDKNGEEIYEGDIIEDNNGIGVVMWFQTAWGVASYAHGYDGLKSYTAVDSFYSNETKEWTVIGNIHDNPELLTHPL